MPALDLCPTPPTSCPRNQKARFSTSLRMTEEGGMTAGGGMAEKGETAAAMP